MKELYIMYDNYTNHVVIRDFSRGNDDAAVIDWDMNDTELRQMLSDFEAGETVGIKSEFRKWMPFEDIKDRMNTCQTLAAYLAD